MGDKKSSIFDIFAIFSMGDKKSSIFDIYFVALGVINYMLNNNDCLYLTICKNEMSSR